MLGTTLDLNKGEKYPTSLEKGYLVSMNPEVKVVAKKEAKKEKVQPARAMHLHKTFMVSPVTTKQVSLADLIDGPPLPTSVYQYP